MTLVHVAFLVELASVTSLVDVHWVIETMDPEDETGDDYLNGNRQNVSYVPAVVASNEQFSRRLYSKLLGGMYEENLVISPWSISTVMTMLAAGARGKALLQLHRGLSLPEKEIVIKKQTFAYVFFFRAPFQDIENYCLLFIPMKSLTWKQQTEFTFRRDSSQRSCTGRS